MVQLFDSWAHHLSPTQFAEFSLPYAEQIIRDVHAKHPDVPLIFHANGGNLPPGVSGRGQNAALAPAAYNGSHSYSLPSAPSRTTCNDSPLAGSGKLEEMATCSADVIGLDWSVDIARSRATLGADRVVQGNVDPMVLFGSEAVITAEVERVLSVAGPSGHILNVGHGVVQGTPEESVGLFCDLARRSGSPARELAAV